mgnify:CR=1 FL=1
MKTEYYIGCSSYATPSWKSEFYPDALPKKEWFDYYCQYFKTYEFNGSFYRFPNVQNLNTWYDKTPENFQFSIKVPKLITHTMKLEGCAEQVKDFYSISHKGFKDKLACILWQFPPRFFFTPERLATLINLLDSDFKNVTEFRHISWWNEEVKATLGNKNITFCTSDYLGLPNIIQKNTSVGYIRLHGAPKLFYSHYSTIELKGIWNQINNLYFDQVYVYFNNTASTAGIVNALEFLGLTK